MQTPHVDEVASLCVLGLDAPEIPPHLERLLARGIGGVFLYGKALGEASAVRTLVAALQAAGGGRLLIAIDQEGGVLQEWGPPFQPLYPAPADLGAAMGADDASVTAVARVIGDALHDVGINVDFAPVLDVHTNPQNPIIGRRSFGGDPELVSRAGNAFMRGLHAAGVMACGKHFPGHGDTSLDSHKTLPHVAHGRERLEAVELAPFRAAIAAGIEMIMTAHVLYPALDPTEPGTLSTPILRLLREELRFTGLVVTDDLKMRGIRDRLDLGASAIAAINAGCDLVLSCTEHDRHEALLDELIAAVGDGRLRRDRFLESVERVRRIKAGWETRWS